MPTLHEIFHRFPKEFPLPMLLDGSTGTSLMRCGMPNGACPESWVLEHPDAIQKYSAVMSTPARTRCIRRPSARILLR